MKASFSSSVSLHVEFPNRAGCCFKDNKGERDSRKLDAIILCSIITHLLIHSDIHPTIFTIFWFLEGSLRSCSPTGRKDAHMCRMAGGREYTYTLSKHKNTLINAEIYIL